MKNSTQQLAKQHAGEESPAMGMSADQDVRETVVHGDLTQEELTLSDHALTRMQQRGLSPDDIAYVLRHGQKRHAADAQIYFLRDKDLPQADGRHRDRLRGTAVVVSRLGPVIITVWRNREQGLRHIKRKPTAAWQAGNGRAA